MHTSKEQNRQNLNVSTKCLVNLVFSPNSLSMLLESGLINVYIDDYGHKCRYKDCLLFLFDTDSRYYNSLERKITAFQSFCDWYDVSPSRRMLVFKIGSAYKNDLDNFKHMGTMEFSEGFQKVTGLENSASIIDLELKREIYRNPLVD